MGDYSNLNNLISSRKCPSFVGCLNLSLVVSILIWNFSWRICQYISNETITYHSANLELVSSFLRGVFVICFFALIALLDIKMTACRPVGQTLQIWTLETKKIHSHFLPAQSRLYEDLTFWKRISSWLFIQTHVYLSGDIWARKLSVRLSLEPLINSGRLVGGEFYLEKFSRQRDFTGLRAKQEDHLAQQQAYPGQRFVSILSVCSSDVRASPKSANKRHGRIQRLGPREELFLLLWFFFFFFFNHHH